MNQPHALDPAPGLALDIRGLEKTYASGEKALKGVDLAVPAGDFFALLGPNGAGKSTLIGIVSSLVRKSAGTVIVNGHDIDNASEAARASIGLVPQEFNFNVFEPVIEIVTNSAGYHGIRAPEARERAEHYLNLLELWDKRKQIARQLSGGMKRRLMIARALVHDPQLLVLDEPTAGVDIEIRRTMWDFLRRINDEGKSVILTTHYLEEAEALCRNVAIINHGEVIEQGSVSHLLSESMVETFVLDIDSPQSSAATDQALVLEGFVINEISRERLEVEVPRGNTINSLISELSRQGIIVQSLRNKSNRLEEFFLRLVQDARSSDGTGDGIGDGAGDNPGTKVGEADQ